MKLVNLTATRVVLVTDSGIIELEPTKGKPARVESVVVPVGEIEIDHHKIPIGAVTNRLIDGLPEQREDTLYVVSGIVSMLSNREDAVCPTRLIRSEDKKALAARALLQGG